MRLEKPAGSPCSRRPAACGGWQDTLSCLVLVWVGAVTLPTDWLCCEGCPRAAQRVEPLPPAPSKQGHSYDSSRQGRAWPRGFAPDLPCSCWSSHALTEKAESTAGEVNGVSVYASFKMLKFSSFIFEVMYYVLYRDFFFLPEPTGNGCSVLMSERAVTVQSGPLCTTVANAPAARAGHLQHKWHQLYKPAGPSQGATQRWCQRVVGMVGVMVTLC